jgi:dienelactone hydrolase
VFLRRLAVCFVFSLGATGSYAQLFGNGPEISSMQTFGEGKFQFQSVKTIYWPQIVGEGHAYIDRAEKVWVPARLYMPASPASKVPAMIIVHGIGGLYTRDGKKRAYWEYAEMLAANGVAALVVDTHGARGVGVSGQLGSTEVSVYAFAADAFAAADILRTHPRIDGSKVGIMGFSKGGMTTLLATDQRFADSLSRDKARFGLHIAIYPGCQNYPEHLQPTKAPVKFMLGEKDNYTGISGCYEIEDKLKAAGTPVTVEVFKGAYHAWDEDVRPYRVDDVSTEDCRWVLKDGGGVWGGGTTPLDTAAEGQAYFRGCVKKAEIMAGHVEPANRDGRKLVLDTVKSTFAP